MDSRNLKRITVFAGHYGSGKTNIAINYALKLKESFDKVTIADLDIVNPYFRTKDSMDILKEHSVKLISSPYANTNVDTPALPAETYSIFHDVDQIGIIDVGGDDRGALALGRYADYILKEGNYEFLFVINKYRYLTSDPQSTIQVMREIEEAAGMKFTGIVNNSNLGDETTAENVINSLEYADKVASLTGLNIKMTCAKDSLCDILKDKVDNLFPITLYVRQSWAKEN
ncbi:MAG: MinD/ParA family protein [Ruminococcaceae bacterium]|nr:MinD/ParA family protein [Oscillospiraceae bacterium]